ncbi:hypothetical protein [Kribbella sp. NPDC051770]|uniref:hypothetical protein n=1 Tax=Kribbella sp. NPDC051770 TaxID=3155413 RepID=UPI00342FB0B2
MTSTIRPMVDTDPADLFAAFAAAGWDKPITTFNQYLADEQAGSRSTFIATVDDQIVGYVTVNWRSPYEPFEGMPEIQDFNVCLRTAAAGSAAA